MQLVHYDVDGLSIAATADLRDGMPQLAAEIFLVMQARGIVKWLVRDLVEDMASTFAPRATLNQRRKVLMDLLVEPIEIAGAWVLSRGAAPKTEGYAPYLYVVLREGPLPDDPKDLIREIKLPADPAAQPISTAAQWSDVAVTLEGQINDLKARVELLESQMEMFR